MAYGELESVENRGLVAAGGMEDFLATLIKRRGQVHEERARAQQKGEAVLLLAREQGREKLEPEEDGEFRKYMDEMRTLGAEIVGLDERIEEIRAEVERSGQINSSLARIRRAEGTITKVREQAIYQKGDHRRSYMQDMIKVALNVDDTGECRDRLLRHAQDVATLPEYMEFRDISRVDGQGGYAVPPAWLMNQYIELARPGRAFANLVQRQPLPGGTDSINIPKILTGTAVGVQTADNTTVTDVDLTDTFINAPVRTISGQQGVAIQLIDQSPIAFDDVVFRDLVAAHAAATDQQVLSGSGSGGQVLGVNFTPGILTVAVDAVTIQGVYSAIANAIQQVHTQRFLPPEVIVMHPRRWGWFQSLLDTADRPLFLPAANGLWNAAGVLTDVASQQVVGQMFGLPVVTDPNISINSGSEYSSTPQYGDEDVIYVLRASDIVLWESGIRARVLPETKAANLTVLLQIYNYLAFSAARYPASVVTITGLTPPAF
jgi:HK97 family phage major capsid protein